MQQKVLYCDVLQKKVLHFNVKLDIQLLTQMLLKIAAGLSLETGPWVVLGNKSAISKPQWFQVS